MSMTLDDLERLFDAEGLTYFAGWHTHRPAVLASFQGINSVYQVLTLLEVDGTFLQLRSLNWLHCPTSHPAVGEVLKATGDENYQRRLVKIGWNPSDGELVAYADVWIEDGTLTQRQFSRMLSVYLPVMDMAYGRLKKAIETGHDPGMPSLEDALTAALERGGAEAGRDLPDKIRKLLGELPEGDKSPDSGAREPGSESDDYV
jgi:Putative bacterial sensory transduction regulator